MTLVILIGASGSGKTTIARAVAATGGGAVKVYFFDSIGVPLIDEMIAKHGSGEAWQRAQTIAWMRKLAEEAKARRRALFEGQTRFSFLAEGAAAAGGLEYISILVDCDDATRTRRLALERRQPELANSDTMNWARYLRNEAQALGRPILDTSALSLSNSVQAVMESLES